MGHRIAMFRLEYRKGLLRPWETVCIGRDRDMIGRYERAFAKLHDTRVRTVDAYCVEDGDVIQFRNADGRWLQRTVFETPESEMAFQTYVPHVIHSRVFQLPTDRLRLVFRPAADYVRL